MQFGRRRFLGLAYRLLTGRRLRGCWLLQLLDFELQRRQDPPKYVFVYQPQFVAMQYMTPHRAEDFFRPLQPIIRRRPAADQTIVPAFRQYGIAMRTVLRGTA